MDIKLFDTHAHYNDEKFDSDRENIIQEIYQSGVKNLVNAGYSLSSSKKAIEIAKNYPWMYVICGISPNDIPETQEEIDKQIIELEKLIIQERVVDKDKEKSVESVENQTEDFTKTANKSKKIVAVGEIGLDYYWNKENKQLQKYAFIKQIELANRLKLPIVIHTREAIDDTIDILRNKKQAIEKGVFHCCPLNRELIKQALQLGFYISFAGPITFKNAKNANEMIEMVPLDRILIETDSPYLAPEPHRGTRNDSRNVYYMAKKIAEVKGCEIEEIASQTYENAKKIFYIEE